MIKNLNPNITTAELKQKVATGASSQHTPRRSQAVSHSGVTQRSLRKGLWI